MEQDLYGLQASGIDPEIAAQMLGLKRKRSVADALMQQALSPLKADRVASGGLAVPISPWEGLAQLAKAYIGKKSLDELDAKQGELTRQNQAKVADAYSAYQLEKNGAPSTPMTTPVDDEGNTNPMVPGTMPNPRAAVEKALMNPLIANNPLIKSDFMRMQPVHMKADERLVDPVTNQDIIGPQKTFAPEKPMFKEVGLPGNKVQEHISLDGGKTWNPVPGSAPTDKFNPRPSTQVSVSSNVSTEKKYGEHFGAKVAEQDVAMRDAAIKAPELAKRANDVISLLDDPKNKPYIGTAADFKKNFDKILTSSGITDESGRAVTTEVLSANLAGSTLDAIKGSGLGAGNGFSNADRDFLEKVVGGKITLEEGSIRRLAQIHHKVAELTAGRWNDRVKTIPKSALEGTGLTSDPIKVPAFGGMRRRATDNPASQQIFSQADAILGGR